MSKSTNTFSYCCYYYSTNKMIMQRKVRTRIKTRIKTLLLLIPCIIIIIVVGGVVAAVDTSSIQEQYEQVSPFSMISLSLPNMKMNCNHHKHNHNCNNHKHRRRGKYKEEQQSQVLVEKWNDIQKQYRQKYHYQQQQRQQQQQNLQLIDNYYYYTKFERQLMGLQPFIIQTTCTGTVPTDKTHTNTVTTTTTTDTSHHHTHQHTSTTSTTSSASSTPQHQHNSSSTNKNSSSFTSIVQSILYSILLPIGTIFVLTTISSLAETIYYNKSSILSSISTNNYSWVSNCIDIFYLLKVMDWKSIPFAIANLVWKWNNDYHGSSSGSSSNNSSSSSSNQHDKEYSHTILLRNEKKTIMSYIMSYYSHSNMNNIVSSIQHIVQNNIISPIKSYIINHELIPRTHQIITKLIYMELWRHFWIEIFVFLRTHVYKTLSFAFMSSSFMSVLPTSSFNNNNNHNDNSYKSSFWEKNAPGFLKRGLKSLFIKYAQGHLEKLIGDWFTKGYDFIGLEVVGGNSWTLMEEDHNDNNDNNDVGSDYDVNNTI